MAEVYWHTTTPADSGPDRLATSGPLPRRADVAVVGAGFAGLSIALDLLRTAPGLRVAVLEAHQVGYGASGRNAGLVLPLALPWLLARSAGRHNSREVQRLLHARVNDRLRQLQLAHPAAEARPARLLLIASNRLLAAGLGWAGDALQAAGIEVQRWSGSQVTSVCGAPAKAAITLDAWTVQPAALAASLARQFVAAGGALYERTRVTAVTATRHGVDISIEADQGRTLRADQVVVCAGAYTTTVSLPDPPRARPVHTYMRASGLLTTASAPGLGDSGLFMAAPGPGMAYWRLHNDHLLFGGRDLGGLPPGEAADTLPRAHRGLDRLLRRRLPAATCLPVAYRWGGPMHVTPTEIPHVARSRVSDHIVYALGFGGSGVALTLTCGPLARDLLLGEEGADPEAVTLRQAMQTTTISWSGLLSTVPTAASHLLHGLTPHR